MVMKLFNPVPAIIPNYADSLWIAIEDALPDYSNGLFRVRTKDSRELWAYYYSDLSPHWWDVVCEEPIKETTHYIQYEGE